MNFKEFLTEGVIADIKREEKLFLLIIGGSASGKNYYFEKNFDLPLVDVDAITKKLSGGDYEKARKFVAKAVSIAGKELEKSFKSGTSIAQVTTGAGAKGVENKLKKAKEYGFKTALILVDTDLKTALKRNAERAALGKQGLIPDWKVEKTNKEAKETYQSLQTLQASINTIDYAIKIKDY